MIIRDVLGPLDPSAWIEILRSKCGVATTSIDGSEGGIPTTLTPAPRLLKLTLPAPSSPKDLSENDAFFASVLDMLPTQNYTVLYTTSRAREGWAVAMDVDAKEYDMDASIQESLHMDLKRDLGLHASESNNQTMIDGPLFDKYQFFTPGMFPSTYHFFFTYPTHPQLHY